MTFAVFTTTFLGLLKSALSAYLCSIATIFVVGLTLILLDKEWTTVFAELYLKTVAWVQDWMIKLHDTPTGTTTAPSGAVHSSSGIPNLADEDETDVFDIDGNISSSSSSESGTDDSPSGGFELVQFPRSIIAASAPLDMAIELCGQGIESIVKEDVGESFRLAHDYRRYELNPFKIPKRKLSIITPRSEKYRWLRRFTRHRHHNPHYRHTPEQRLLRVLLCCSLAFRVGALFPIRLAFLLASFVMLFVCCVWDLFRPLSALMKTRLAVIYCRLYTTGCGFITRFQGTENRPKRPGVICANHLSPNDIHIIFGDIPADRDYLYLVTGQKHHGLIWILQNLVDKVCPALWLERSDPESRRRFSIQVLEAAKTSGPVILFPEGYCTNNSHVLMFRRAVFQDQVTVYPVAIKQEPRFGDAYWSENSFMHYLFRVLTSWALVYNVFYLAPQHRRPDENATEFAARVQRMIAARVGARAVAYDGGGIWYKPVERQKALSEWQSRCAKDLNDRMAESEDEGSESSGIRTPPCIDSKEELLSLPVHSSVAMENVLLEEPSTASTVAEERLTQQSPVVATIVEQRQEEESPEEQEEDERRRRVAVLVQVRRASGGGGSDSDEMDLIG